MSLIYKLLLVISLFNFSISQHYTSKNVKSNKGVKVTFQKKCPCKDEPKSNLDENYHQKVNFITPTIENTGKMLQMHMKVSLPIDWKVVYPVYMAKNIPSMTFPKQIMVPIMLLPVFPSTNSPVINMVPTVTMPHAMINLEVKNPMQDMQNLISQQFYMDILHKYTKFYASKQPYSQLSTSNEGQSSTEQLNNFISFD